MKEYISNLINLLPDYWLKNLNIIVFLTLINAIFEILSIGLIIPFISIFIDKTDFLKENFNFLSTYSKEEYVLIILILFIILFSIKNIFLLLANKKKIDFSHNLNVYLTEKLYSKYINKRFDFYIIKNSSELTRNLLIEIPTFCYSATISIINLITQSILFFTILIFLLIYNPLVTIIVGLIMITLGSIIIIIQQKKLKLFTLVRQEQQKMMLKLINESIGNIKEIILSKMQSLFSKKFFFHLNENANVGKLKDFYFIIPRPSLEILVIFMLFLSVFFLVKFNYSLEEVFIVLGVFSFASLKLIPAITAILQSIQNLRNNQPVISLLNKELFNNDYDIYEIKKETNLIKRKEKLEFNIIKFNDMNFKYLNSNYIFKDINLEIKRGEKIGIVGKTGSGKTTLVNLLIGLLTPSKGKIYIDDKNIFENLSNWQKNIGYVSQETFLADETLLFNIVLQALDEPTDKERCKYLIRLMDLEKLIESKNEGLDFVVGEKGIKLSGGQIQRIGIARALYKKPEILILDEATNALDVDTQNKIIQNVYREMREKTIISISHDIHALEYCDKIFSINKNQFINFK